MYFCIQQQQKEMGNFLTNISRSFKGHKNVVIIIMVALVVELISATQYYYAHNLLEKEMDSRAEGELSIKAVLIKGILNMAENTMKEHIWDFKRNISHPDSMFAATERTIENSPQVKGFCLAFVPYYYPEKGQLFEPYIYKEGNNKILKQLGGENKHDYTQHPAFQRMEKEKIPFWSDPYDYVTSNSVSSLITFFLSCSPYQGFFSSPKLLLFVPGCGNFSQSYKRSISSVIC